MLGPRCDAERCQWSSHEGFMAPMMSTAGILAPKKLTKFTGDIPPIKSWLIELHQLIVVGRRRKSSRSVLAGNGGTLHIAGNGGPSLQLTAAGTASPKLPKLWLISHL